MAKQVLFGHDAREGLKHGVEKLGRAVRPTLGPKGRFVLIDKSWGAPTVTKDGASVAEEVELSNPYENMGAQMIKAAAQKTSDEAGDGTTTSTILAEAIFLEGFKAVAGGADSMSVSRGVKQAADAVLAALDKQAEKVSVKDRERIVQVGTIAANGDAAVGEMLADAFAKVGAEGAIAVEEGKGIETEVKIVEGMQFDRGFLSPQFVNSPESVEAILENPLVFIHEDKLSSAQPLIPLLEKVSAAKKSLLIIAEEVEGEALALLVVNKLRGILNVCAVKAPGYGDRRKAMLEDIAVLTGGRPVFKDLGIDLLKIQLSDLGSAKKVIADADNTTIIQGVAKKADIDARCAQIRRELETSDSDYDKEKLQERLSKLSGGVAQIHVGAATETELKERKQRVEDALHAVRAALQDGVVPGGGVAFLRASNVIDGLKLVDDEKTGAGIVRRALEAPIRQLAESAGVDGSTVIRKVRAGSGAFGFNVATGEYGDLRKQGVLDPLKVVKLALQHAASVSGLLLTSEACITDIPEPFAAMPSGPPGGGMEGMGGMGGMGGMPGMGGMGGMPGMGGMGGMMGGMPGMD